ncbi:glycosyltransferase family 39 protein [Candidatus Undinarchaeota archaeon]
MKKEHYHIICLAAILLFGLYLRTYHLDYPVIGYHNWKEVHYLTEARNFANDGFFKNGFFVPAFDYPSLNGDPSGVHADSFPTISVIVGLFFMLFGQELWIARLVGIVFNLGAVVALYYVVKILFKREDLAMLSMLLGAIMPIFVFFSRNVQLVNPALLFMLLSIYYYAAWHEEKTKSLLPASLFFVLATITKYSFGMLIVPLALSFPYKRLSTWRKNIKDYVVAFVPLILIPIWIGYVELFKAKENYSSFADMINTGSSTAFSAVYWKTLWAYFADNYTILGLSFAIFGFFLMLLLFKKGNFGMRFSISYVIGTIAFFILGAHKLQGHNYHQYPVAPLFVILIAYFIIVASSNLGRILDNASKGQVPKKYGKLIIVAIMLILLWFPISEAKNRQFDAQFFGLDIAGEYINTHSSEDERIMFSGHQSYGVLWHADRKGYAHHPSVDDMISAEKNLNVQWILVYQWGMAIFQDPAKWNYIKDNYSLRQVAFKQSNEGRVPIYFLFQKGGSYDDTKLNDMLQGKEVQTRDYEMTGGNVRLNYIELPEGS